MSAAIKHADTPVLEVNGLGKSYQLHLQDGLVIEVLRDISLRLNAGDAWPSRGHRERVRARCCVAWSVMPEQIRDTSGSVLPKVAWISQTRPNERSLEPDVKRLAG